MNAQQISDAGTFWNPTLADELLRFLTGRVRCPQTAAELTHDTYLGLQQAVSKNPPENIRAMAFRIAVNLAIDYQRKLTVRDRHSVETDFEYVSETIAAPSPEPDQILMARERLTRLNQAMDNLPIDARTAFILHGVEGLTYAEIAARLGVSKAQVNKLLAFAMTHCAQHLDA